MDTVNGNAFEKIKTKYVIAYIIIEQGLFYSLAFTKIYFLQLFFSSTLVGMVKPFALVAAILVSIFLMSVEFLLWGVLKGDIDKKKLINIVSSQ